MNRLYLFSIIFCLIFLSCFGPSQSYPTIQQIAFQSARDGNFEIYTMDIDGYNQVNLTNHLNNDKYPQFSIDGTKLLFCSDRNGDYDIYIMTLDWYGGYTRYKSIDIVNLSNQIGHDLSPVFSPTGKEIAFESFQNDNYEIFIVDTSGSEKINLTNNIWQDRRPSFSPDGEIEMGMMRFI